MTRYAIDVDAASGATRVGHSVLTMEAPYASPKFTLLSQIALANRCQAIWNRHEGHCHLFGIERDRGHVELLYVSLLLQATSAMTARGSVVDEWGRNRTRAFRQSFLVGYAAEVGARLAEATERVVQQSGPGTALVLAARDEEVDAQVASMFPKLRNHRPSVSSGEGIAAGQQAATSADLGAPRAGAAHRGGSLPQ